MKLYFIRHGKTKGNEEGRYIGTTNESLSAKGKEELKIFDYPKVAYIYVSPMKRCIETAEIIYPGQDKIICEDLRETDFGIFEGKNYKELNGNLQYQAWLDSNGTLPFPDGESREQFTKRCVKQFETIIENHIQKDRQGDIAIIVHGGTIMAILEQFALPKKSYYDWQIKNGEMLAVKLVTEASIKDKIGEKENVTFALQVLEPKVHGKEHSNPYFPIFFNLKGKKIIVAGAGTIGTRRVKSLLGFGAAIVVIAPEISEELKKLSEETNNNLLLLERNYQTADCTNAFWVIAATNSREINYQIGVDAKNNGALVTVSDAKEESTVYFPGIAREDNIVIGITASGKNHFMARKVTERCRDYLRRWL